MNESWVSLMETLFIEQYLSWFAALFEKLSPILNNFEMVLAAFVEAFEEYDKRHARDAATTKIRFLWQRTHLALIYASNFILLACNINLDKFALMSQFHCEFQNDVNDLILSMFNPKTLNEVINQSREVSQLTFSTM